MLQEVKLRLVRVDDFVADTLEAQADKMPPWAKFQAENWRDVAKDLRESESTKIVWVREEPEPKQPLLVRVKEEGPQQLPELLWPLRPLAGRSYQK
jgi:hypothetical protein